MAAARLALAGLARRIVGRRGGAVQPLAAESKLVLASVDAEAETLTRGLAPDAAAALVQAVLAVGTQAAGRGTERGRGDGAARTTAPGTPRLVRPPLAVVAAHAALAADVVGAVRTRRWLQRQVAPFAVRHARDGLVDVPRLTLVRQLAPAARSVRET